MLDVENLHRAAGDLIEHQIGSNRDQFPQAASHWAASVGLLSKALDRRHEASCETLRCQRCELADIGSDPDQVGHGSGDQVICRGGGAVIVSLAA